VSRHDPGGERAAGVAGRRYSQIACSISDSVLTLTLNRPDRLNAFTATMADELEDIFSRVSYDSSVGAVIVTGAGKAFCAGMDLSSAGNVFGLDESLRPTMADLVERFESPPIANGVRDAGGRVSLAIFGCRKPVLAAINGQAIGVGATMTLAMDIRLISTEGRMGFVFSRLGIVAEACSTWFLPRLIGLPAALDLLYSGEILDAAGAADVGLVRSVVAPDELLPAATSLAHRYIDGRSGFATAAMRQMLYRNAGASHPIAAHRLESLAMFYASLGDGKEGVQAFLEKRPPEFTHPAHDGTPDLFGDD
jgi:enoyl-CoA hydratase/carnithine racemase